MVVTGFIDREEELRVLDNAYASRPCLVVIYGRRRVGKTRLVLEWCSRSGARCVYYHALPARHEVNLAEFIKRVEETLGLSGLSRARFETLDSLLEFMSSLINDVVIVIDEFTYWVRAEPRVVGELQRFVDHVMPRTRFIIALVGSLVGVMYRDVLGGGAPLYGRAGFRLRISELEPWYIPMFYPWLDREGWVRAYALLGGVPHYHALVGEGWGIDDIIRRLFLEPGAPLRDEAIFLLREEFRDYTTYYSILRAMAQGATGPSEITNITGIPRQHVGKYLHVLEQLGLIERERVLFTRRGIYRIRDRVLSTWFRLIEPVITSGITDPTEALRLVKGKLEMHVAEAFEEVARKYVESLLARGLIRYDELGRFMYKGVEVDLVAIDHANRFAHLFEVKWSDLSENDVRRIIRELEVKARRIPLEGYEYRFHVISRRYEGPKPTNADVVTISDMPFMTK
ncbi:ATP-binding protein [Vulcanisaeta sp. JCM 16161]|uniref:ATP-binding protein n=1 Tax=Vulcanisaeta sp. JCM 16161 TaxID=1295372 RepID=UPI00406D4271